MAMTYKDVVAHVDKKAMRRYVTTVALGVKCPGRRSPICPHNMLAQIRGVVSQFDPDCDACLEEIKRAGGRRMMINRASPTLR